MVLVGAVRGVFLGVFLGTVCMVVATGVVLANTTVNATVNATVNTTVNATATTAPVFVDEETAELMYNASATIPAPVLGSQGLASISAEYNSILRNALASAEALNRTFARSGRTYCWQCEQVIYVEALERLPIPLHELSTPSANMLPYNYTHLLRNSYASGIDVSLLQSVVRRLDIATIRSSYALYNSSLTGTPTYPITSLDSIRSNVQVVFRQLRGLCRYGSSGYPYDGISVSSAGAYCDYVKWVQLRYIIEGVPTLLITYSAMDIAVLLVETSELISGVGGSTVDILPLSTRGLRGMESLKESLYGEMLKDYSSGAGSDAYLKALVLQRLDAMYSEYTYGVEGADADADADSYWQGVAATYAKESYHIMGLHQAPLVSLGGSCWDGLGSPEDGEGAFLQNIWLLAPQYGTGDAPAQSNVGSIICLPTATVAESVEASVLIINTNRPYQYACKLDTQGFAPCLRTKLKLAVTDEVASLLAESAPQVFNHYQSTPIWGTMNTQHSPSNTQHTPAFARVSTGDILTMSDSSLLLYATYQYLVLGSFMEGD